MAGVSCAPSYKLLLSITLVRCLYPTPAWCVQMIEVQQHQLLNDDVALQCASTYN